MAGPRSGERWRFLSHTGAPYRQRQQREFQTRTLTWPQRRPEGGAVVVAPSLRAFAWSTRGGPVADILPALSPVL
jgi:hypothetical protein